MAIWQIPIELVPEKWAEENEYRTSLLYDEDGYDTTCAWIENQPTEDLDVIFSNLLPKAKSWSEDLVIWGSDKKHDISVWEEEGVITSIGLRIDLRENITSLMTGFCDASIKLNCVLFIPGQEVMFKPNVFELKQYIFKSNAAKYVSDPYGYLNELSKNEET